QRLGLRADERGRFIARAIEDASPRSLAALDAATRLGESLAAERALDRGAPSRAMLDQLMHRPETIPDMWWSARLHALDRGQIVLRGAVLMRLNGVRSSAARDRASLPPEFARALTESAPTPLSALRRTWRAGGAAFQLASAVAVALAAASVVGEAMILRAAFDITGWLAIGSQRWWAVGAAAVFLGVAALVDRTVSDA